VLWQVPAQEAAVRKYPEHGVDHASIVEFPADLRPRSGGRTAAIGPLRVTQLESPSRPRHRTHPVTHAQSPPTPHDGTLLWRATSEVLAGEAPAAGALLEHDHTAQ
jgi:hypothetical protein